MSNRKAKKKARTSSAQHTLTEMRLEKMSSPHVDCYIQKQALSTYKPRATSGRFQGDSHMLPFNFGPVELILILVIVAMLFGVGKLPEVFGAVGKGIREFRKESGIEGQKKNQVEATSNEQPAISSDSSAPQA